MLRQFTRRDFLNFAALAAAAPIFEVKPLRGIDFILQNSPTSQKFLIETMSGGAATATARAISRRGTLHGPSGCGAVST